VAFGDDVDVLLKDGDTVSGSVYWHSPEAVGIRGDDGREYWIDASSADRVVDRAGNALGNSWPDSARDGFWKGFVVGAAIDIYMVVFLVIVGSGF
jgi:hypothetical protein